MVRMTMLALQSEAELGVTDDGHPICRSGDNRKHYRSE